MIKILHMADIHLGVTLGPFDAELGLNGRVADFLDTLDAVIEYADDNEADLILIAGDCFHKSNPDPTYLREFAKRVVRMGELAPTIIIPGNHDLPGSLDKASAVDIFDILNVPNVTLGLDYNVYKIATRSGMVQVGTAPWPRRSEFLNNKELGNLQLYKDRVESKIAGLYHQLDEFTPAILVGHFTVGGSVYGNEKVLAVGDAAEVNLSTLKHWDYVALGHIHLHQDVSHGVADMPPVVYSGSLDRVDFGDEADTKGFVWVEIDTEEEIINYDFVEVDARPFVTIPVDVVGVRNPMPKIIKCINECDITRAIVRVIITIEEVNECKIVLPEIAEAITDGGAYYHHSTTVDRQRQTTPRLNLSKPIGLYSPAQLLSLYFKEQGIEKSERLELLKLAKEIMDETDREI